MTFIPMHSGEPLYIFVKEPRSIGNLWGLLPRKEIARPLPCDFDDGIMWILTPPAVPEDAATIPDWPAYKITPAGEVWRVVPAKRGELPGRPCPRRIAVIKRGSTKATPSVHLSQDGYHQCKTVAVLLRETFGAEVAQAYRDRAKKGA